MNRPVASDAGQPPAWWESDVVLSDGGTVHLRPSTRADAEALAAFRADLARQGPQAGLFGTDPPMAPAELARFVDVDHDSRVVLVAELGEQIVALARYDRLPATADTAEVVLAVREEHQGRGIATVLLEHLAAAARERGITRFVADTPADNWRMLDVLESAGFDKRSTRGEGGLERVELLIEPTDRTRAAVERREHQAEAASVARLLTPRAVAVVGASRDPDSAGHQVLRNLLAGGFAGPVFPVNPQAEHVASVKAYPTIGAVPGRVDLAVIAVPAPAVAEAVRQCAAAGVTGLVVLTAGFGEIGRTDAQDALRDLARRHGMRLVGPNCIGVTNTAIGLNATFAPDPPAPGRVAMQSQSGALGIVLLQRSARLGLGVSSFVSVGNKADVSGNDLLQYWEDDPATEVVLLYLEAVGNPAKFARIARRVSRRKPIVAVKAGRSAVGARAASSHTAAMASPDLAVDALFRQAGVIRVDTVDELFDAARLLAAQPLPAGRRVAIVSNAGGPGIIAADACVAAGLEVPELAESTQAALRAALDPNAAVANPVDLVASATPAVYERALQLVLADPGVDSVMVMSVATYAAPPRKVAEALQRAATGASATLVGCFLATEEVPPLLEAGRAGSGVPIFSTPEPAARALGRASAYAAWRRQPPGRMPELAGFDLAAARAVIDAALAAAPEGGWQSAADVGALLAAAGVPAVRTVEVNSAEEAAQAAAGLGRPVAVKAAGPDLVHKTDVGGVRLGVATPADAAAAYRAMAERIGARMTGGVVQEMVAPGVETIVGVVHDPLFGPLVMFGMGGTATELLGDRSFRILPLTERDAAELVRSLRSSPLLFGYRGAEPVAVDALEDVLQRIARLAGALPELAELEVNPLIASLGGVVAVDARARVAPAAPGPPAGLRRMP